MLGGRISPVITVTSGLLAFGTEEGSLPRADSRAHPVLTARVG